MSRTLLTLTALSLLVACTRTPTPAAADPQPAPVSTAPAAATPAPEPTPEPDASADTWELPGSLHPLTTQAELEARFGKQNVREETVRGGEGIGNYPILAIFPDEPRKRLELVMDEGNKDSPIRALRVKAQDSVWHAASGVYPGMTLPQLAALNAAPVSFYGLGWDYSGTVQDWHGGRLANAVGNTLFQGVVLGPKADAATDGLPMGDSTFRSDSPALADKAERLVVTELSISWPHDDEG